MQVSAATWSTLSKLLDEALDLDAAARDTWLERLSATQPALAPSVRKLLEAHASSETADVMARLPTLDGTAAAVRVSALTAGDRIGPYRLKRELGSGGMADVWLAERADGAFTREVALKLPLINRLRRDLAQRFARERDILARLEHPHIARLYDAGVTDDGLPYLAMEYVDGQSIIEYCDQRKVGLKARLKLFRQVLDAVQFAHANLIIHRDLKPSNILVTAEGQVRLLDFGIAKLLADSDSVSETQLTQLSGRALTPDYASPEQIKGEPLTIATDIYSLGVVLYELLVGSRPYRLKVKSAAQLEQAIIDAEPARPSVACNAAAAEARGTTKQRLERSLSGDLDTIALKALIKSPAERYSTIAAFADDLQRHSDGRPVLARPTSWVYRTRKFAARNKLPVAAASSVLVTLVVATGVSLWQAQRAQLAATNAQRQAQRAEAVRDFLSELFRASGSQQRSAQQVRNMTAVELLDRGASRVDTLQQSAPDAHAHLLRLFGEIHEDLKLYDRSIQLHERSVAAARAVHGMDAYETVMAEMELAWVLKQVQRGDEGWPLVEHAQTILGRVAPRSADYAQALYFESAFLQNKNPERAVRAGEAAVHLMEELGQRDYRAATARWILASSLYASQDHARAVPELRKAASEFEQLFGPDYVNLGTINKELSQSLYSLGQVDEAQAALRSAIQIYHKHAEQRATGLPAARISLSVLLQATGDRQGAGEQLDLAMQDRLQSSEKGMPTVEQIRGMRAVLLVSQGSLQQGIGELLELQASTPQNLHLAHLAFCDALARAYVGMGNLEAASGQIARGKRILEERGATSYRMFALAAAAARVEAAKGNAELARQELNAARKALNIGPDELTGNTQLALVEARVYEVLGQTDRSRTITAPLLERLLADTAANQNLGDRGELALLAGRARIETDPDMAGRLLQVAVESLRKTQVPTSPLLKQASAAHAALLAGK